MRIIAGKFRSRRLQSLPGTDIRPTSDRLRETLFSILLGGNPDALAGSIWLDLFAGTGAVGIEALSRGAGMVYFVEASKAAAELVRQNLQSLKIASGFEVMQHKSERAIRDFDARQIKPDFIFLDPPYQSQQLYRETLSLLGSSLISETRIWCARTTPNENAPPEFLAANLYFFADSAEVLGGLCG